MRVTRAEEGGFLLPGDAGGIEIGIDVFLGVVMGGDLVAFAALLVQAEPGATALGVIVLDLHRQGGADAGEAEHHNGDQCPVAELGDSGLGFLLLLGIALAVPGAAVLLLGDDAGDQLLGLVGGKHGRLALLDDVLGAAYRVGRVEVEDAAAGQTDVVEAGRRRVAKSLVVQRQKEPRVPQVSCVAKLAENVPVSQHDLRQSAPASGENTPMVSAPHRAYVGFLFLYCLYPIIPFSYKLTICSL